jgi:hypothetical protein
LLAFLLPLTGTIDDAVKAAALSAEAAEKLKETLERDVRVQELRQR